MSNHDLELESLQLEIRNHQIIETDEDELNDNDINEFNEGYNYNIFQFLRYHIVDYEYDENHLKNSNGYIQYSKDYLLMSRFKKKYMLEKKGVNKSILNILSKNQNESNSSPQINNSEKNVLNNVLKINFKKKLSKINNQKINQYRESTNIILEAKEANEISNSILEKKNSSIDEKTVIIIEKELNGFPNDLLILKNTLLNLNLSKNYIEYIPIDIKHFINLKVLRMDHNKIQFLPSEFACMQNLEILSLSHNYLTSIPSCFSRLSKSLKQLYLEYNLIEKFDVEITELTNLIYLNISKNRIKNFPTSFKNMAKLNEFVFEWFNYIQLFDDNKKTDENLPNCTTQNLNKIKEICNKMHKQNIRFITFTEFIDYMSTNPIKLNQKTTESKTLLHYASINEDFSVIQELIRIYPDMLDALDDTNHTAFSWSLVKGKNMAAKYLFMKGANPFIGGGSIGTPLHIAVEKLNIFLLLNLIELGENPNRLDADSNTPLHIALLKMHENHEKASTISKILLDAGAEPNLKNKDKWTPLHIAARKRDHIALEWIIKYNSTMPHKYPNKLFKLNKRGGQYKWTAIHIAAYTESPLLAQVLCEASVDIFKKSALGYYAKRLVGSGGVTMKIIEKYERKWLKKFIFPIEIQKERAKYSYPKSVSIINTNFRVSNLSSSLTKISYTPTEPSYLVGSSKPSGLFSPNIRNSNICFNSSKVNYAFVESKNCQDICDICPETEHDLSNMNISQSIGGCLENVSEIEESKIGIFSKKQDDILERNVITRAMKNGNSEGLAIAANENKNLILETLHFDAENYDEFLKDELEANYQSYKEEVNNLKEKLIIDQTILSEKLKIFGMLKILHNRIMSYLYDNCQLQIDKNLYGLIYYDENFAETKDGSLSKNALIYMNHYYELVPNAIFATYISMIPNKIENVVIKLQLILLICDIYYLPGLKFLQDIIKDKNEQCIIRSEAQKSYNYLKNVILINKNKLNDELNKKKQSNIMKDKAKNSLLKSQKEIFKAEKKTKIKF